MHRAEPFAFLSSGPILRIKILLSVSHGEVDHGPNSFICNICRLRWLQALEIIDSKSTDSARIKSISMLWLDGHVVGTDCGTCEGCRIELEAAASAAVLAESNIDVQINSGPVHNVKTCSSVCKACLNWEELIKSAADKLTKTGFSSKRWIQENVT